MKNTDLNNKNDKVDDKNKKLQLYSDLGYIEVDPVDYEDNSITHLCFEKKIQKIEGKISKKTLTETINVNLKTLYGNRKTYTFEVSIKAKLSVLIDKLIEEESKIDEKQKWNPYFQYRLISTNGLIKELNPLLSFIEEEIKNNFTLILASPFKIYFSDTMKHTGIYLEDLNSIAHNQSGNEDHLVVLCDRGYKSGKHYIEFTLESEPCESSTIVGLTHLRSDYYFNLSDYKNFWGYIPSEGSKIGYNDAAEVGLPCKIKDKIGLLMLFNLTGLDLKLFINNIKICTIFKNLPLGPCYYPCAILKFDGSKIRVSNRVPIPSSNNISS